MAFYAVCAVAGALAHLVTHAGDPAPMIGASAAISGTMAGAMRFAFQRGGPLSFWRSGDHSDYQVPAVPLTGVLRDPAVFAFLVVWFGINLLFGRQHAADSASAPTRWWPGRRISAASSPACCCFPGSIRRRIFRNPAILVQCIIRQARDCRSVRDFS